MAWRLYSQTICQWEENTRESAEHGEGWGSGNDSTDVLKNAEQTPGSLQEKRMEKNANKEMQQKKTKKTRKTSKMDVCSSDLTKTSVSQFFLTKLTKKLQKQMEVCLKRAAFIYGGPEVQTTSDDPAAQKTSQRSQRQFKNIYIYFRNQN